MPNTVLARYLREAARVKNTGGGTDETSYYEALGGLLNSIGGSLKPSVKAVFQLKDTGSDHPDFGLFTAQQFDREGDFKVVDPRPERGAGEVKPPNTDLRELVRSEQVRKYLAGYGLVLVTNLREFAVVVPGPFEEEPVVADEFSLAATPDAFWALARQPETVGDGAELEAFLQRALRYAVPVDRPQDLAQTLASYARQARARLDRLAEAPGGLASLDGLRESLEATLGASFDTERGEHFFRATVIQTLFYGVFSAWTLWHREQVENEARGWKDEQGHTVGETEFRWRYSVDYLRVPVIAELFHQLTGPKVKQLGVADLLDRTERLLARVRREKFFALFREAEAVQYFYEPFLEAYDPMLRKELGVWYTPPELVRYMVARVDRALKEELGEAKGLASENVVVLDPSCGTGAFLVEVLRHIRRTLEDDPDARSRIGSRLRKAATERLFGFELLTAPFVVAHLQIGLALRQAGAPLAEGQRAAVYLTNALTGWTPTPNEGQMRLAREFEEEVEAARHVKRDERILVVLGNPPYDGHPGLAYDEERSLVEAYRTPESPLLPKPKGRGLNDLYIRFYRVAERQIAEKTGRGIVCYVSNNSWLDGSSHSAMRERFLDVFDSVWVDNLHGDSRRTGKTTPEGDPDPSIFSTESNREGIQVGTAVALLARKDDHQEGTQAEVQYRDFWGADKLETIGALAAEGTLAGLGLHPPMYDRLHPELQLGLPLLPRQAAEGYFEWASLPELFPAYFPGVQTARDDALVDIDREQLVARMRRYFDSSVSDAEIAETDPALMRTTKRFDAEGIRRGLLRLGMDAGRVVPYHYRPFDVRWLFWIGETKLLDEKRSDFAEHVFAGNRWLVSQRKPRKGTSPPMVTRDLGDLVLMDPATNYFPLQLAPDLMSGGTPRPNLSERGRRHAEALGVTAEDLFYHALAVMHAPAYREENAGALKQDWPRIPLPDDPDALRQSAALGREVAALLDPHAEVEGVTTGEIRPELRSTARLERADGGQLDEQLHLNVTARWGYLGSRGQTMPGAGRTETRPKPDTQPIALGDNAVDVYLNDGTRWATVPEDVWNLTLGGYPVLKKWLSYRDESVLGRPLTLDEADHFRDTARRLAALLLFAADLDEAYDASAHPSDPYSDTMELDDLREMMLHPEGYTLEGQVANPVGW